MEKQACRKKHNENLNISTGKLTCSSVEFIFFHYEDIDNWTGKAIATHMVAVLADLVLKST